VISAETTCDQRGPRIEAEPRPRGCPRRADHILERARQSTRPRRCASRAKIAGREDALGCVARRRDRSPLRRRRSPAVEDFPRERRTGEHRHGQAAGSTSARTHDGRSSRSGSSPLDALTISGRDRSISAWRPPPSPADRMRWRGRTRSSRRPGLPPAMSPSARKAGASEAPGRNISFTWRRPRFHNLCFSGPQRHAARLAARQVASAVPQALRQSRRFFIGATVGSETESRLPATSRQCSTVSENDQSNHATLARKRMTTLAAQDDPQRHTEDGIIELSDT